MNISKMHYNQQSISYLLYFYSNFKQNRRFMDISCLLAYVIL